MTEGTEKKESYSGVRMDADGISKNAIERFVLSRVAKTSSAPTTVYGVCKKKDKKKSLTGSAAPSSPFFVRPSARRTNCDAARSTPNRDQSNSLPSNASAFPSAKAI
uniref:Uncharacterized protein n=1 Tax=Plectus sambesii TaxID=2011161 RepID=A0A914WBX4_9BILA